LARFSLLLNVHMGEVRLLLCRLREVARLLLLCMVVMHGAWSYDTPGDTAVRTAPEGRTLMSTITPVNHLGRSVDASSASPPAFRQVVPTPMRSTERYASRITYSDMRPVEGTDTIVSLSPRRQSHLSRLSRSARSTPLSAILPFYVRSLLFGPLLVTLR